MNHTKMQRVLQAVYRSRFDDELHKTFHGEGYSNFGYWTPSTAVGEHGDCLVDRLLDLLPAKGNSKILDVACGQGGTTKRLTAHFPVSNITAINLFEDQLEAARKLVPGCTFVRMDAADLVFPNGVFDVVLCVEAAFHFETREKFLRESWRVLKPGGHLILSDVLMTPGTRMIPKENVVTLGEYETQLKAVGFPRSTIVRVLDRTWTKFWPRMVWHCMKAGHWRRAVQSLWTFRKWNKIFTNYLLICSQKPQTS